MAIEVFNRREQKYMLDDKTYNEIIKRIEPYMESDAYSKDGGFYSICNIYYDTPTDELIRKSISKPVYKEKLRLRAYGTPGSDARAFVEIKKKYKGIVNKRRTKMPLSQAREYLDKDVRPSYEKVNQQVMKELDYFKSIYNLLPKVYISYDRRAYFAKDDDSFRITFDTNLKARRYDLELEAGSYGDSLLQDGKWLMEVKISDATPNWFAKILADLHLYPTSFSKYGTEYTNYIKKKIEKGDKLYV